MSKPVRLQSAFISESEIKNVAQFLADNSAAATTHDVLFSEGMSAETDPLWSALESAESASLADADELFDEARMTVVTAGRASTTFLQRKFRIGYARAARLMDLLEERGIVGPSDGAKPRAILAKEDAGHAVAKEIEDEDGVEEDENDLATPRETEER